MSSGSEVVARRRKTPLVILGCTASGKSSLAMELARTFSADDGETRAELISIDSMQVYRGMDIGTAKPTAAERAEVKHHMIDLVEPSHSFAVGEFQQLASDAISDVQSRGNLPILVGGTGLYLRAVIDDLEIPGQFPTVRLELEANPNTESLHEQLSTLDPIAASRMEPTNRRRVLRALEVTLGSGRPFSSYGPGLDKYEPNSFVQIALRRERDELDQRISARYDQQVEDGFVDEARWLIRQQPSRTASQALGYRELMEHLSGNLTLDAALDLAKSRTRRFARRQERWFRRDPRITWIDAPADVSDVLRHWDEQAAIRAVQRPGS